MTSQLIAQSDARQLWLAELRKHGPRGWHTSKLSRVMFDWSPRDGITAYHPAAAWPTIADRTGHAPLERYMALQRNLIEQGYRFSDPGSARSGGPTPRATGYPGTTASAASTRRIVTPGHGVPRRSNYAPLSISFADVAAAVKSVMDNSHPVAVRQEQILRASLMTRLPAKIAASVGTFRSAVHAEMPTPSGTYQRTGTRPMRARYDVGFGHLEDPAGIIGVMELKAGMSTFDQQLGEGFAADFEKLLDPLLPPDAFRISWALAMRSGRISSRDLAERAAAVIAPVESKLGLRGRTGSLDAQTGWFTWRWSSGPTLYLAWYRPDAGLPDRFSPAWR